MFYRHMRSWNWPSASEGLGEISSRAPAESPQNGLAFNLLRFFKTMIADAYHTAAALILKILLICYIPEPADQQNYVGALLIKSI